VALVDELAAMFSDLSIGEVAVPRPAPSAEAEGGLIDGRGDAGLSKAIRTGEPGQSGTDDNDAWRSARSPVRSARRQQSRSSVRSAARRDGSSHERSRNEVPPAQSRLAAFFDDMIDSGLSMICLGSDGAGLEQAT